MRFQIKDDPPKENLSNLPYAPFAGSGVGCTHWIILPNPNCKKNKQKHEFYEKFLRDKPVQKVNVLYFTAYHPT